MKFITIKDITVWADTVDCKYNLPHLIRKLITATIDRNQIKDIQFSYGEEVHTGGFDGQLITGSESTFIPLGESVWEFGTTNNKGAKANDDYEKRKNNPLDKIPKETTYININAKKYRDKNKWANEKKSENYWKDVRYYDALDIEQWLELAPTVELWLAEKLNKPTLGIYTYEEYWKIWSEGKSLKIVPEILLGDSRLKEIENFKSFLSDDREVLYIKSVTKEEAIVFPLAILNKTIKTSVNVIVIDNRESFNLFTQSKESLIVIVKFKIENIDLQLALKRGHKLIIPISLKDEVHSSNKIQLPIVDRNTFENGLIQIGVDSEQARILTKSSGRNISVLRRLLKFSDSSKPKFIDSIDIRSVIPILLVNRFTDYFDGDKEIIEKISGKTFDEYLGFLKILAKLEDSPVYYINQVWRLVSPTDTWLFFAKYITQKDFEIFEEICFEVLTELLHKYTLPLEQRSNHIQTSENRTKYSSKLREGICESLIIISVLGESYGVESLPNKQLFVDNIIQKILEKEILVWRSLSKNLMLIAEASPSIFLNNLERIIKDKSVIGFFEEEQGFMSTSNDLPYLLWCLDIIAWFPEHIIRVSKSLCELIKISPANLPTANTPLRSLKSIFRIWYPQTNTNVEDRKKILVVLIDKYPKTIYNLLYQLIKTKFDTAFHLPRPKWRLFSELREIQVTNSEFNYMRSFCIDNVISMSKGEIDRILPLIDLLDDIEWDRIDKSLNVIESILKEASDTDKDIIYDKFRSFLGHHRTHPSAHWSLPNEVLDKIEKTANKFKTNKILIDRYLFDEHYPKFIEGRQGNDYAKHQEYIDEKRLEFIYSVIEEFGIHKIFELAKETEYPFLYGQLLAQSDKIKKEDVEEIYNLIHSKVQNLVLLVTDFIRVSERRTNLKTQLEILNKLKPSQEEKVRFFIALNSNQELWTHISSEEDKEIEKSYWKAKRGFLYTSSKEELFYALEKLAEFKKVITYLNTLGWGTYTHKNILTSNEVLNALEKLSLEEVEDSSNLEHFRNILDFIYSKSDYDLERGAKIDMKFLFAFSGGSYGHRPKNLYRLMAHKPDEYFSFLSEIYLPENDEARDLKIKELKQNSYHQKALEVSWSVFRDFNFIPSMQEDGKLNPEEFKNWIDRVRILAVENDRVEITDSCIGQLLAKYPISLNDKIGYPVEIYNVLEEIDSDIVRESFEVQISNNLGFTSRGAFEGGNIERFRAEFFNTLFENIKFTHSKVSLVFKSLKNKYLSQAKWEDENALNRSLE